MEKRVEETMRMAYDGLTGWLSLDGLCRTVRASRFILSLLLAG